MNWSWKGVAKRDANLEIRAKSQILFCFERVYISGWNGVSVSPSLLFIVIVCLLSGSSTFTIMSLEQTACEDLKAFERRLTEVIGYLNPQTKRWRVILFLSSICTAIGAWQWLMDPVTSKATFFQSLMNHMFFTISSIILVILFLMGIHKRVVTPSIIVSRVRNVLSDFNMSCDDSGRLILRPRPTAS